MDGVMAAILCSCGDKPEEESHQHTEDGKDLAL